MRRSVGRGAGQGGAETGLMAVWGRGRRASWNQKEKREGRELASFFDAYQQIQLELSPLVYFILTKSIPKCNQV